MYIRATIILAALCCFGPGSLSAQIYRSTDADGNVVFTDAPAADSKPVELSPASTYSPPPQYSISPDPESASPDEGSAFYTSLRIVQPTEEENLRENVGNVTVGAEIEPALLYAAGHRLQFYLDGEPIGEPSAQLNTSFSNVDRGEHQVEAAVIDVNGNELIRTTPVRFFLHRYSILNSPNTPAPAPRP